MFILDDNRRCVVLYTDDLIRRRCHQKFVSTSCQRQPDAAFISRLLSPTMHRDIDYDVIQLQDDVSRHTSRRALNELQQMTSSSANNDVTKYRWTEREYANWTVSKLSNDSCNIYITHYFWRSQYYVQYFCLKVFYVLVYAACEMNTML